MKQLNDETPPNTQTNDTRYRSLILRGPWGATVAGKGRGKRCQQFPLWCVRVFHLVLLQVPQRNNRFATPKPHHRLHLTNATQTHIHTHREQQQKWVCVCTFEWAVVGCWVVRSSENPNSLASRRLRPLHFPGNTVATTTTTTANCHRSCKWLRCVLQNNKLLHQAFWPIMALCHSLPLSFARSPASTAANDAEAKEVNSFPNICLWIKHVPVAWRFCRCYNGW